MSLFDDFELEQPLLGRKRNIHKEAENQEVKEENLMIEQNPDQKIDNRLIGLIDDEELLKRSDELKLIHKEEFDIKGCTHEIFYTSEASITRKFKTLIF